MEEQKMNEKESLELIAQMIRVTKQSIGSGSGNKFLMYGYTAAILSIVIYALVYFTGNSAWSAGWFLMFLPFLVSSVREKRNRPMIVLGFVIGRVNFGLMMPLALLYCGMGTSITGLVIKESSLTYFPLLALVTAIYMFMTMPSLHTPMVWQLYFGGSFVVVMIVPGHILNAKCKKRC